MQILTPGTCFENAFKVKYDLCGKLLSCAEALDAKLQAGEKFDFKKVIYSNLGNPHALGQEPIFYFREVMGLASMPHLLDDEATKTTFEPEVIAHAKKISDSFGCGGTGKYTDTQGVMFARKSVAEYISKRDGYPAKPKDIYMCDGATPGIQMVLRIALREKTDGVMIPIPQYPLYNACITLYDGAACPYYLDEEKDWALTLEEMERAHAEAVKKGINPRVCVVVNPGNPTGNVLNVEIMKDIAKKSVAEYISKRDGYPAKPKDIYMCDGATPGIQMVLRIALREKTDGVMIPIPQYPLYNACITLYDGAACPYYLDEEKDWALTLEEMERAHAEAVKKGINPRVCVVVNPGNPTGNVLNVEIMKDIAKFCHEKKMLLLADEVYQRNIYMPEKFPWVSFKKIVCDLGLDKKGFELCSVHSTSKGMVGECGRRGGYFELINVNDEVRSAILKLTSLLCVNSAGQIMTHLMVSAPQKKGEGKARDACYDQYKGIFESLQRKAKKLHKFFTSLEGVTCCSPQGALYLFPRITIPEKAIHKAKEEGIPADELYCVEMLESTGLLVMPGSSFGQKEGTYHFRTTILMGEDDLEDVLPLLKKFHTGFMITIPEKAIHKAKEEGIPADELYCVEMLESTGLLVMPGSSFGQKEGTYHFRTTILMGEDDLEDVLPLLKKFHTGFMSKYE
ncbi:Probable alanine aminotransferase, mitochondrial [Aduncisulcus paluster]|uniref:Probable alanine aminotransferase, mitochondrial n=1 Tax=Aduncisulcus paluster TaxID=2918883 RepID=A0ABQ5K7C6_9EUKA|nr:Probable alanine aminotransferase, mitochondrial [Aduncisulcus paluster]